MVTFRCRFDEEKARQNGVDAEQWQQKLHRYFEQEPTVNQLDDCTWCEDTEQGLQIFSYPNHWLCRDFAVFDSLSEFWWDIDDEFEDLLQVEVEIRKEHHEYEEWKQGNRKLYFEIYVGDAALAQVLVSVNRKRIRYIRYRKLGEVRDFHILSQLSFLHEPESLDKVNQFLAGRVTEDWKDENELHRIVMDTQGRLSIDKLWLEFRL